MLNVGRASLPCGLRSSVTEMISTIGFEVVVRRSNAVREEAQSKHYLKFQDTYLDYLRAELARNESKNTKLFQTLLAEEAEKLNVLTTNRFGLNVKQVTAQYIAGRLERFQQMLIFEESHGVLDF